IDVVDAAHTTVRVHCHGRVAGPAHGAGDAAVWRFQARLAKATGRPAEDIADDMRRGRYLDARAALAYGLIDAIRG
ncbi:MAG TPA: ATP-dependent Clp protease proteolytic subunit, partial [Patescibacteria group bacterium]|nr:ATP-dependent Clp protease proteolytic subunit [Patescibacteria group bacterium]